jgi:hypothetical protein
MWNILPGFLLWETWKERNRRTFRNEMQHPGEIWSIIIKDIKETIVTQPWKKQKDGRRTSMRETFSDLFPWKICWPQFSKSLFATKDYRSFKLDTPSQGFLNINFDGVAKGNPGKASLVASSKTREDKSSVLMWESSTTPTTM